MTACEAECLADEEGGAVKHPSIRLEHYLTRSNFMDVRHETKTWEMTSGIVRLPNHHGLCDSTTVRPHSSSTLDVPYASVV